MSNTNVVVILYLKHNFTKNIMKLWHLNIYNNKNFANYNLYYIRNILRSIVCPQSVVGGKHNYLCVCTQLFVRE